MTTSSTAAPWAADRASLSAAQPAVIDAAYGRAGRDPATIRRSDLSFRGVSEPLGRPADMSRFVHDLQALGFRDVAVYWPHDRDGEAALERIAREALPDLRSVRGVQRQAIPYAAYGIF
jgi:hypothetical protein